MFKEIFTTLDEQTQGCFKGIKHTDIVVSVPKNDAVIGVFSQEAINNSEKIDDLDLDIANILDIVSDMEITDSPYGKGDWAKKEKKFCQEVNKFIKRFGVQDDFDNFEPDSKNQTYMKF